MDLVLYRCTSLRTSDCSISLLTSAVLEFYFNYISPNIMRAQKARHSGKGSINNFFKRNETLLRSVPFKLSHVRFPGSRLKWRLSCWKFTRNALGIHIDGEGEGRKRDLVKECGAITTKPWLPG